MGFFSRLACGCVGRPAVKATAVSKEAIINIAAPQPSSAASSSGGAAPATAAALTKTTSAGKVATVLVLAEDLAILPCAEVPADIVNPSEQAAAAEVPKLVPEQQAAADMADSPITKQADSAVTVEPQITDAATVQQALAQEPTEVATEEPVPVQPANMAREQAVPSVQPAAIPDVTDATALPAQLHVAAADCDTMQLPAADAVPEQVVTPEPVNTIDQADINIKVNDALAICNDATTSTAPTEAIVSAAADTAADSVVSVPVDAVNEEVPVIQQASTSVAELLSIAKGEAAADPVSAPTQEVLAEPVTATDAETEDTNAVTAPTAQAAEPEQVALATKSAVEPVPEQAAAEERQQPSRGRSRPPAPRPGGQGQEASRSSAATKRARATSIPAVQHPQTLDRARAEQKWAATNWLLAQLSAMNRSAMLASEAPIAPPPAKVLRRSRAPTPEPVRVPMTAEAEAKAQEVAAALLAEVEAERAADARQRERRAAKKHARKERITAAKAASNGGPKGTSE